MARRRKKWLPLLVLIPALVSAAVLCFFFVRATHALEFYYTDTTLEDFNAGSLYHTGLSWRKDGEVQLLPIGLAHPWETGNSTGLPALSGPSAAYLNGHIYVVGGSRLFGLRCQDPRNEVYYATINPSTHDVGNWQPTTSLPTTGVYTHGVEFHEAAALTVGGNSYLYVFGGSYPSALVPYDTVVFAKIQSDGTLGAWQSTTPLAQELRGHESAVLNGRLYVIGGEKADGYSSNQVYFAQPNADGTISSWAQTTAPLPDFGAPPTPRYYDSAVTVENGRLYVVGGASGESSPVFSPYVVFGTPGTSGDIASWTVAAEALPQNLFAGEGAAYQSGLLLTIAGAWNNFDVPTGDVLAALVDHDAGGEMGEWVFTIAMDPARYWHAVVQDEDGWLYSIGGSQGANSTCLNEVKIGSPYSGWGSMAGQDIPASESAAQNAQTVYAPSGTFTSRIFDLSLAQGGAEAELVRLEWNTTITTPAKMGIGIQYRCSHELVWDIWSTAVPSNGPGTVTTTRTFPGTYCQNFQYKALFTTSAYTQTPFLNAVRLVVKAPPDLVADDVTVTGCAGCPDEIELNEPVQIEFTVHNRSTGMKAGNNFFAAVFITTTTGYTPYPPDCPIGCDCDDPSSCPLIWGLQSSWFTTEITRVLTTTYTFTEPGTYYLVGYVDYDGDGPAPAYRVAELQENNNSFTFMTQVIPPDLVAGDLTVTGCEACPGLVKPGEPVQIEFTVQNSGASVRTGNAFFAALFITTTSGYTPSPPDCPPGCDCVDHLYECPLIWPLQASDFQKNSPPSVLTTTYTFADPGTYYLVGYVDYDGEGPAPGYRVVELQEDNNSFTFVAKVGQHKIYIPLVVKRYRRP